MIKTFPLVSILIPCYNHEKYVLETLNSVLSDTYPNKEIIIIDDGSKDSSDAQISNWVTINKNKIAIKYFTRNNRGICYTLNELIGISNGKYIIPLASDDILINDTIFDRVQMLENNPDKMVLLSDAEVINGEGVTIFSSSMEFHKVNKHNYYTRNGIMKQTMVNLGISGATVLINKDIYDIIGGYPKDIIAEDWYFYQRAAGIGKILFYDQKVSLYRVHDSNTSNSLNYKIFSSIILSFIRNFSYFPGIFFKLLAIKQIAKFALIYLKIRLKSALK